MVNATMDDWILHPVFHLFQEEEVEEKDGSGSLPFSQLPFFNMAVFQINGEKNCPVRIIFPKSSRNG